MRVQCKTLFLSSPNNYSWICLQPVLLAVRRLKIIRFFVICVTTTFVPKIVIFKNMPNHGRNIDVLYYLYLIWNLLLFFLWILNLITTVIFTFYYKVLSFAFSCYFCSDICRSSFSLVRARLTTTPWCSTSLIIS